MDVLPHPVFSREEADLYVTVAISLEEALTGFERDITLLDGSVVTARWAARLAVCEFSAAIFAVSWGIDCPVRACCRCKALCVRLRFFSGCVAASGWISKVSVARCTFQKCVAFCA